jgi:hypothetical protein
VICDFFSETCPLGGSLKHWYTREGLRFEVKTYPELFGKAPERQYRFIPEVSGSGTRLNGSCAARDGGGSDPVATVTHRASKDGVAPAQSGVFFCVTFLILVSFISSFSRDLCASQGEEDGEDEVEVGNSYLLHLLRPNSHRAHRKNFLLGWSDPRLTLGTEPCAKVGSLQSTPVDYPRSN